MTSMTLSKSTIKKAFGGGLSSSECQINIDTCYPQRPKTAVPGKRRPFTDKPAKSEGLSTKSDGLVVDKKTCAISRPMTSYSNRRLSLSNDAVKQKLVTDESCDKNATKNINLEKALEDIDIVEYFYDKSIKDIFPLSEKEQSDNTNCHQKVPFGNRRLYKGTGSGEKNKDIISDFELNTSRLQRKKIYNCPLSNNTDLHGLATKSKNTPHRKSKLASAAGQVEANQFHNSDNYNSDDCSFQRKSNSLKEKAAAKNNLRRRLHSDTDVSHSAEKSSDHLQSSSTHPQVTQEVKPVIHQTNLQEHNVWLTSSRYVPFGPHTDTSCKVIAKYTKDFRLVDHKTPPHQDRNRQKLFDYSAERPDAFQYKTNKFPRKLKPIPGRDNLRLIDKDI